MYPSASDYIMRNMQFRDGNGVILGLTPDQETELAQCLGTAGGKYNWLHNNCGTSIQNCLQKVGVVFNPALRPSSILDNMEDSPQAIGTTFYPGPIKDLAPLSDPGFWGF
jgi:hypothetical protein